MDFRKNRINFLTIDLEEHWRSYQSRGLEFTQEHQHDLRVLEWLLNLLEEKKIKATFFVVSEFALKIPEWIQRIAKQGHEIASHTHSHQILQKYNADSFREDTRKSQSILQELSGRPVLGFRAASWSLTQETLWALDVLQELGFQYDSSVFPGRFHLFGNPKSQRSVHLHSLKENGEIWEFPMQSFGTGSWRIPVCGGFYWRAMPDILSTLGSLQSEVMWYFHLYDLNSEYPIPSSLNWNIKLLKKYGTKRSPKRFTQFLENRSFTTLSDFLVKFSALKNN
jgi:polysaccharide deacetylase family protein (PEP-CTERM system associated)